ncbi:hypothetical protein HDU76_007402 [Blyttiomyces sp. JEL0837]|nr:hypothetical protein HDU76_007402 [Blyttiomyces sp. JEL0837]
MLRRQRLTVQNRHYLVSSSLGHAYQSHWHTLRQDADDRSYMNVMGLTVAAFEELFIRFAPFYIVKSGPGKKGRPTRLVDKRSALGLLLHFYASCLDQKTLCEFFCIPPSTLSRTLSKAELAMAKALKGWEPAAIKWPSKEQQRQWESLVEAREPVVKKRWGFVDGKNFAVMEPSNSDLQNAMYNGWLHAVFVTGILVLGVDGCIVYARHNCPGSWNDGENSRGMQEKLLDPAISLQDHGLVADSAFPVSKQMWNRILTPLKDGEIEKVAVRHRHETLVLSNAITSIQQAAEWGVGAVPKVWRHFRMILIFGNFE